MYWVAIYHYLQGRSSRLSSSRQHQLDGRLLQSIAVARCSRESFVPVDVALFHNYHCILDCLDSGVQLQGWPAFRAIPWERIICRRLWEWVETTTGRNMRCPGKERKINICVCMQVGAGGPRRSHSHPGSRPNPPTTLSINPGWYKQPLLT